MILLALLLVKHFLADFPLQSQSMVAGKGQRHDWWDHLIAHCCVHWILTCAILWCFVDIVMAAQFATIDGATHFIIDRLKAHPDLGGRWKPADKAFWNALGLDQLAHGLIYVLIASQLT